MMMMMMTMMMMMMMMLMTIAGKWSGVGRGVNPP
jgi:hypothetical protein